VGGVGVVGLAVGTVFGLKASANWSDAKDLCGASYPNGCGDDGVTLHDNAKSAATISSIAFAVGVVGVAGGAILWFTAPSSSRESAAASPPLRVGFDGRQLLLRGAFE
jgi:serine/threonine-protein kinase